MFEARPLRGCKDTETLKPKKPVRSMVLQDSGSESVEIYELIRDKYVLTVQPKYKRITLMDLRVNRPKESSIWAQFLSIVTAIIAVCAVCVVCAVYVSR